MELTSEANEAVAPGIAAIPLDGPLVSASDSEAYFGREAACRALGTDALLAPPDCLVVAYKYSGWHATPYMESLFGQGWTEYELLKRAAPQFRGHAAPKAPLWGYFDERRPEWAAREIDLARQYGIGVWMINWYWHDGVRFFHEHLEDGLLKAPNCSQMRFALMWANHDWRNVFPADSPHDPPMLLPQRHSEKDTLAAIDYCVEHYFGQPNYWRLNGALVFGIFDFASFEAALGPDGVRRTLERMRERVAKAGLGELHIQSSHVHGDQRRLKEQGVDSATFYHTFAWTYMDEGHVRTPYGVGAAETVRAWKESRAQCSVPFFPDCPVGWDDSPRFGAKAHIVSGRTPDQYEWLCRAARHFAAENKDRVVFLSAWNEWTEDHVLLPDTIFGYSYLEAVRRVFATQSS